MYTLSTSNKAPNVLRKFRVKSSTEKSWDLKWKPVCSSTEIVLSNWIKEKPFGHNHRRAVLAARQNRGIGQHGRKWHSPLGGVWISAAFPLENINDSIGLFGLAVAVALCERLERNFINAQIKWPNDLVVGDKKLAGFLPRIVHRGSIARMARIGLGLNVYNTVPVNGISLYQILGTKKFSTDYWSAETLLAFDQSVEILRKPESLLEKAEERLLKNKFNDSKSGISWEVEGLANNGGIRLNNGKERCIWTRWE